MRRASWRTAMVLVVVGAATGCAWNWDALEPPSDGGSDAPPAMDVQSATDVPVAADTVACGQAGEPCCGGTSCNAPAVCSAGRCVACSGTMMACSGACVDTQTDRNNCGGCGQTCAHHGACQGGSCQ